MNKEIEMLLHKAIKKYGIQENIYVGKNIELKEKWTSSAVIEKKDLDDYGVRNSLIKCSRILEEDLEKHIYVALVKLPGIGNREVLLVSQRTGDVVSIATFAKEGLISQRMAEKAIDLFKECLNKKVREKQEECIS